MNEFWTRFEQLEMTQVIWQLKSQSKNLSFAFKIAWIEWFKLQNV